VTAGAGSTLPPRDGRYRRPRAGDAAATEAAVAELELLGPVRATPIGAEPMVPTPERVRDEINELVHELDDAPEPTS